MVGSLHLHWRGYPGFRIFVCGYFFCAITSQVDGGKIMPASYASDATPDSYDSYDYDPDQYRYDYTDSSEKCSIESACVRHIFDPSLPLSNATSCLGVNRVYVDCFDTEGFPFSIPPNVTTLSVQASVFSNLTYEDMKNFTQLRELTLQFNDLYYIETRAFQAQRYLKVSAINLAVNLQI